LFDITSMPLVKYKLAEGISYPLVFTAKFLAVQIVWGHIVEFEKVGLSGMKAVFFLQLPAVIFVAGFIGGCAHNKARVSGEPVTVREVIEREHRDAAVSSSSKKEIHVRGMKLANTDFDIPITINSRVEFWIDYFQTRGRVHFEKYLERSEHFVPYIVPLLKQHGLPEDLVYLAMIESGFNNHARSRAKAVGPWQFISATGKRYGLMINWWVDERRDTRKSTLSAVGYLKDLYTIFKSWELAAAAYNSGEAKIARAIRRFGTKDFWTIARHRFLRPETRDYVPKIIAAAIIAKNREQFGFASAPGRPGDGEVIAGDGEVVKLEKENEAAIPTPAPQGAPDDSIANILKKDDGYDAYEDAPEDLVPAMSPLSADVGAGIESMPLAKPVPTPHVSKKGELIGEELVDFEVQSPADLLKVARAAGLSYQTVKGLNPELLRWCTPPNLGSYRIRLPSSAKDRFMRTYNHLAYPRKVHFLAYKVRKGETLSRIARHFGIRVDPIVDLNGMSPRLPLRLGTRVLLPMPNDPSRSLASLEVRDPPERRRYRRSRRPASHRKYRVNQKRRADARSSYTYSAN